MPCRRSKIYSGKLKSFEYFKTKVVIKFYFLIYSIYDLNSNSFREVHKSWHCEKTPSPHLVNFNCKWSLTCISKFLNSKYTAPYANLQNMGMRIWIQRLQMKTCKPTFLILDSLKNSTCWSYWLYDWTLSRFLSIII